MSGKAGAVAVSLVALIALAVLASIGLAIADIGGDPVAREIWVWVGRIWTGLCGVLPLALAVLILGGAYIGLGYALTWARSHAALIYHRKGQLPAVGEVEPGRPRLRVIADQRNQQAEVAGAIFDGNVDRANTGGIKALLRPPEAERILPDLESEPLRLPAQASIYTAPLPSEPALLLGAGGDGQVALPLRNIGGGVIGGLQGMGKSELLASLMAGLLRQDATGRLLRLGLIDMKGGLDFARMPGDLAAWQWPIATDEARAVALIGQLRAEIERRTMLLVEAGVNTIEAYNVRSGETLPYLVVLIDELMFLTAPALEAGLSRLDRADSRAFIGHALRCLAVGRASGVSLIMATQKPSADVVPTRLRDLAGWRVAFRCATFEASRAILGQGGAEALPHEAGRALLWRGAGLQEMRAYLAGIEGGDFDRFTARLARADRLALPEDAEADGVGAADLLDGPEAVYRYAEPVTGPQPAGADGIPVYVPQNEPPWDTEAKALIYRRWLALGSLKAVERELYNQEGGVKFYWVRDAVNEMRLIRGRRPVNEE